MTADPDEQARGAEVGTDDGFVLWNLVRIGIGIAILLVFSAVISLFLGSRGHVRIIEATRTEPGKVWLAVASCNQRPYIDEAELSGADTYEVRIRTKDGSNGEDCGDIVDLMVDPALPRLTIVDQVGGETFTLLGSGEPAPAGLAGTWRMTIVDDQEVTVGRNTAEPPVLELRVDDDRVTARGNFGCNERSIVLTATERTISGFLETLEGEDELCSIPEGSEAMVLTERTLTTLFSRLELDQHLSGDSLEWSDGDRRVVFERIAS